MKLAMFDFCGQRKRERKRGESSSHTLVKLIH